MENFSLERRLKLSLTNIIEALDACRSTCMNYAHIPVSQNACYPHLKEESKEYIILEDSSE